MSQPEADPLRAGRSGRWWWLLATLIFLSAHGSSQSLAVGRDFLDDIELLDVRTRRVIPMGAVEGVTVEGFEILYATPGTSDISEVAGHLLLRIKLGNNPAAKEAGIENPYDLVLSFLADTERGKPVRPPPPMVVEEHCRRRNWFNLVQTRAETESPWESIWQSIKGLGGGFFLVMDRQTLEQAVKHYTVEQDRNLLRYELMLTPDQEARLIDYLYELKCNYRQRYYFFSMNCGSALVRVLGEGIGDEVVAEFDPLVSPPHSLVALLVRRGLARRVVPAFYSTTSRGFMARSLFVKSYPEVVEQYPDPSWPPVKSFFAGDETVRTGAVISLHSLAGAGDPELRNHLFKLSALMQEAEMVFDNKREACEDYTSAATAEARRLQAFILEQEKEPDALRLAVDAWVVDSYSPVEQGGAEKGGLHTGLYQGRLGGGYHDIDGEGRGALRLSFTMLNQEMGSSSSMAMQRGDSLTLGEFGLTVTDEEVLDWQVTGLRLRKFRDTLDRVESGWFNTRGLGLGLRALEVNHDHDLQRTRSTLFGAEVLFNVASSARHARHLYLFGGANGDYMRYRGHENITMTPSVGFEGLVTLDEAMRWQGRASGTWLFASREENSDEFRLRSSVRYRLGETWGREIFLGVAFDYDHVSGSKQLEESQDRTAWWLELTVNQW